MEVCGSVVNNRDVMAKECYNMMCNMYQNDYSEFVNMFYGIHVSVITELNKDTVLSIKPEPFFVLSLPLPMDIKQHTDIFSCMDEFCKTDILEGENEWFNEKTNKKQSVNKGLQFWSLPNILIIHLKRWNLSQKKDKRLVSVPLEDCDFTKYIKGYNASTYIYELYGVCNHHGTGEISGHYTANVKNANGQWYTFNDMSVTTILPEHVINVHAYCLFFRKKK